MKRIVTIVLAIVMCSCHENLVDLDIEKSAPKLVIGGLINSDSSVIIKVTKTVHALQTDAEYGVKDATVLLYENETLKTQLFYDPQITDSEVDDVYRSEDGFTPSSGNVYTLRVNAEGYREVNASTRIPEKIPIADFQASSTPVQVGEFLNGVNAQMTFQDAPNETNFYSIVIREEYKVYNEYDEFGEPIESKGFVTETLSKALIPRFDDKIEFDGKSNFQFNVLYLSDIAFNGQLYTFKFLMHAPNSGGKLTVFLNHITKEHYQYGTTSQLQQLESTENPFSQPVQVYTNIENGLGIFSGYGASSLVREVP